MKKILLAFQFLTIIPLRVRSDISEKELSRSASFFPLVGAFQGLLAVVSAALLLKVFSAEIVSALIVLILIISNGGFHLDGLADTFDALSVKSSGDKAVDREKRLSAMKDSSTGAIGVIAIVSVIMLKFLFINNLFSISSIITASSLLFLMPVFSKWVMIPAMYYGVSARQDGLGKIFLDNIRANAVIFSSLLTIIFCLLITELHLHKLYGTKPIALFFILVFALYIFSFLSVKFCEKKFGGLTGDTLGAISEISEILFLMVVTVWLQHFI